MTATIRSLNIQGLDCTPVDIEVDVANGLPQFIIVGLPDAAVSEARDRVRSAIKNSGFPFPRTRVTVNLAPAHTRKIGSLFDLPIALGILAASGVLPQIPQEFFVGELALNGTLRPVRGALPLVDTAMNRLHCSIYIPQANTPEVSLAVQPEQRQHIFPVSSLKALVDVFCSEAQLDPLRPIPAAIDQQQPHEHLSHYPVDMQDIVGQPMAKRALEVAAAGGHNLLMVGAPGVGKSMLAQALASILPRMTSTEMIEATTIHSLVEHQGNTIIWQRPFRAPHHTTSPTAIIGGGVHLRPGEISLAHHGVLFLDELPEFRRDLLEALRQPLETGSVTIHRIHGKATYPARCMVVAAMNPCPCGFYGLENRAQGQRSKHKECECLPYSIEMYKRKISGPLLDRMDIKMTVSYINTEDIHQQQSTTDAQRERSSTIRQRVEAARTRQYQRQGQPNAALSSKQLMNMVSLDQSSQQLMRQAVEKYRLSMRGYHKTLKVALTIADLAGQPLQSVHLAEAIRYTAGFEW
ncbi:MAG: YifB family Mg chelatase-like AAA ATPase [Candidatus Kerfeldbacteria bacterium]|nr:YifB family Mg chelatase-like AAA ATPase [Candidatus Kerfeldbacteria bacterium]